MLALKRLDLRAENLGPLRDFYEGLLGLPLLSQTDDQISFQAGRSLLCFHLGKEPAVYHFAFNIAPEKIESAADWLEARTPLREADGRRIVDFSGWNAHAVYFADPFGNILEFIARHDLAPGDGGPFGPADILGLSEIGLVVPDVGRAVAGIQDTFGLQVYKESQSPEFAALGTHEGLLIVVREGRLWFSSPSFPAESYPAKIEFEGGEAFKETNDIVVRP